MKKLITTTLGLILLTTLTFAQDVKSQLNDIKAEFKRINSLENLEMKDIDTGCGCGCGGIMAYYYQGNLVKIVDYYGHPESSEITEYYYKDGQLIFVYDELETFVYDTGVDGDHVGYTQDNYQGRFYFENGELINKDLQGSIDPYISDDIGAVLIQTSNDNRALLNNEATISMIED